MPKYSRKRSVLVPKKSKVTAKKNINFQNLLMELTTSDKAHNFAVYKNRKKQYLQKTPTILSKKIVIKNFKSIEELPEEYKNYSWTNLNEAVRAIQNCEPVKYNLEDLYQTVQNLCAHNMGDILYNKLKNSIDGYVQESIIQFFDEPEDLYQYIKKFNIWWLKYCHQITEIRSIFLYLDRTYILRNRNKFIPIIDMGMNLLQSYLNFNPSIQTNIENAILLLIKQEREGEIIDQILIRSLTKMLMNLNLYNLNFVEKYNLETNKFYCDEAKSLIEVYNIPVYLKHVNQRIVEERRRISLYLPLPNIQETIKIVLFQLLGNHLTEITNKGFIPLLENNATGDLSIMFNLYKQVKTGSIDGTIELSTQFSSFIKTRGINLLSEPETEIIENILEFKNKIDNIVNLSFNTDPKFVKVVKESFEFFLNKNPNKPAELLAKFVDLQLKMGNKKMEDDQMDKLIEKIMVIFRFIYSKDVFEAFYKKDLAKRLLIGKSASVDAEKNMLTKLKQECGGGFTCKLEGMFKDMEISKDINTAFKQYLINIIKDKQLIDLSVNVLTIGFWPSYPLFDITLPDNMVQYQNIFKNFYLSKHSGRKLQWQPKLGHCILQGCFSLSCKEFQVSLFQTLVLLLFNTTDCLTYEDIKQCCNIEESELKATLQSLACGKVRVLKKMPKGKNIEENDRFQFNNEFTNKYFRVKINQVQIKETPEEQKATQTRVFQDRQYQIDAAIVRIMKSHRTLSHNLLMSELLEKLKFPMGTADLKRRIESLIDQEYIERDSDNSDQYHYVA